MKYKSLVLLAIILLFQQTSSVILAQSEYQSLKRTYHSNYSLYTEERSAYETARQKYLSFGTLSAQTSAISAARSFITSGATSVLNYLDILNYTVRNLTNFDNTEKQQLFKLISDDQAYYRNIINTLATRDSLAEIEEISSSTSEYFSGVTKIKINLILVATELDKTITIQSGARDISNDISRLAEDYSQSKKNTINNWYAQTLVSLDNSDEQLKLAKTNIKLLIDVYEQAEGSLAKTRVNGGDVQKSIDDSQSLLHEIINNTDEIIIQVNK